MLRDILTPAIRKPVYVVYALAGLVLGGLQVWYATAGAAGPEWVAPALAVYAFVGGALGFTAASNTPTSAGEVAQAAVEADATPPPPGYTPRHVNGPDLD